MSAQQIAIVGAGVTGLTCGIVWAESGNDVAIYAAETGARTTSAAAGAIWFPYDCEPRARVIPWALETYRVLAGLSSTKDTGVSMIELRQFCRAGKIAIPDWAESLGAKHVAPSLRSIHPNETLDSSVFTDGFALTVPLTDTTIYLDYLAQRFRATGGTIHEGTCFEQLEDVDPARGIVINCAGFGAKKLVADADLEPHRGQVALVPGIAGLDAAIVCDDAPLMYAIPRSKDCVFGGTNERTEERCIEADSIAQIVAECSRVLQIDPPPVVAERVGIRPFRRSGVRLERGTLPDGRVIVHNYGHGGAGFTLSWGCARETARLAGLA